MASSPYRNWITFLLAHLLLTLNFLVIKHYLLDESARPAVRLAAYLYQESVRDTPAYQQARESIEQILDQACRFVVANVVTGNLAAIVWFLAGYPSCYILPETILAAFLSPLFNIAPRDSGLLIVLGLILHQVFKSPQFAKTARCMRKLISADSKRSASDLMSPQRASALFLTSWLTNHLFRALSHQPTIFGQPVLSTPLNLYAYFAIMFGLPVVIRHNFLGRRSLSSRHVLSSFV